ncbi:MAG: hypothetical protein M0Z31_07425 [Clostridia bacterium]|nr:hypothetical protein [Clostridia bacterium]
MLTDTLGEYFNLWTYPDNLILKDTDPFALADLTVFPIQAMLLVQYMPRNPWQQTLIFAGVALVNATIEYLTQSYTDLYQIGENWSVVYSFLAYIATFWLVRIQHLWYIKVRSS